MSAVSAAVGIVAAVEVSLKDALREAYARLGITESLPKTIGKFGSPMRGTTVKGYRLDPPHDPAAGRPEAEEGWHLNFWDYANGSRASGRGWKDAIRIQRQIQRWTSDDPEVIPEAIDPIEEPIDPTIIP
jgi:hypothetical protein